MGSTIPVAVRLLPENTAAQFVFWRHTLERCVRNRRFALCPSHRRVSQQGAVQPKGHAAAWARQFPLRSACCPRIRQLSLSFGAIPWQGTFKIVGLHCAPHTEELVSKEQCSRRATPLHGLDNSRCGPPVARAYGSSVCLLAPYPGKVRSK